MSAISAQETQEEIDISSLTLKEKIAQMVMVKGDKYDPRFAELGVGGIFLAKKETKEEYKEIIIKYQEKSKIKLLVAADMEGYWNPFSFFESKHLGDINTNEEAYALGKSHAEILKEIRFNLDFSPVVESKNTVWPGRSFKGTDEEIKQKASAYIKGLQENGIMATAKHYPCGSMEKDPHWFRVRAEITETDLTFFDNAIESKVSAIMVGHPIVRGAISSNGKQSTVSKEVIDPLRNKFDGLIITDDINMLGLRLTYFFKYDELYVELVKAGNDIILDSSYFLPNYSRVRKGIDAVERAVKNGEISEDRIDSSVKRILEKKGYKVIDNSV